MLAGRPEFAYDDRAFPTEVWFGDTHVHTAGFQPMPAAARGSCRAIPTALPAVRRWTSNTGQPVRLARPLDFHMITDHSDGRGAITDIIGCAPNAAPRSRRERGAVRLC